MLRLPSLLWAFDNQALSNVGLPIFEIQNSKILCIKICKKLHWGFGSLTSTAWYLKWTFGCPLDLRTIQMPGLPEIQMAALHFISA